MEVLTRYCVTRSPGCWDSNPQNQLWQSEVRCRQVKEEVLSSLSGPLRQLTRIGSLSSMQYKEEFREAMRKGYCSTSKIFWLTICCLGWSHQFSVNAVNSPGGERLTLARDNVER